MKKLRQKGQTLLLALLILAGVSAAAVGFAVLIINLIQGAENIENSISAFYGARSRMEQCLYWVKYGRQEGWILDDTINNLPLQKTNFITGVEMVLKSVKTWDEKRNFFLNKDESAQIDLFDPNYPFAGQPKITGLWISWDNNPSNDPNNPDWGGGSEWVEVSWVGWKRDGTIYESVEKILISSNDLGWLPDPDAGPGGCPDAGASTKQCYVFPLDPDAQGLEYYRVRVKALYDKVEDIEVRGLDGAWVFVDEMPGHISLKTIGKFGRSQQALSASMPWRIPTSGLFDYVIFTEEKLKKTPGNP